jgi:predicted nucleic acid-binding protein
MLNVISNTSCLIALSNINRLEILQKRYERIIITPEVALEFGESLPDWVSVIPVKDTFKIKLLINTLDIGEASTIALAAEVDNPLIILDDGKARRYAKNIGLAITGTLGILMKAQETGIIHDALEAVADLRKIGFWIPDKFEDEVIRIRQG